MTAVTHSTRFLMRMICVAGSVILFFIYIASLQTAYAAHNTRADAINVGQIGEKATGAYSIHRYISRIASSRSQTLPIIVKKKESAVHSFSRGGHDTLRVIVEWFFLPVFFGFEHPMLFCFVLFCLSVLFVIVEEYRSERKERTIRLARYRRS